MIRLSIKSLGISTVTACALLCVVPAWSQTPAAIPLRPDPSVVVPSAADVVPVPQGWLLSYDDEFNGTSVDPAFWDISTGSAGGDNGGQYWAPDDVSVQNGYLRIAFEKRNYKTSDYTVGEASSSDRVGFLYGRVEIRAKMPKSSGARVHDSLRAVSESGAPSLDLLQYFGNNPGSVLVGNFWEGPNGSTQQAVNNLAIPGSDPTQWHTYTLNWEPGDLSWYIDGVLCAEQQFHVPSEPMGLLLSNIVSSYAGDPSAGVWPQEQDIDYVRVYRLAGLPPPVQAGPDQQVQLAPVPAPAKGKPATTGAIVSLQGSTCHPQGDVKTVWSVATGPGDVVFDDANSVQTKAHFKTAGTYVLELTASHGADAAMDTTKVIVESPADVILPAKGDTEVAYLSDDATSASQNWGGAGTYWLLAATEPKGSPGTSWALLRFDISKIKSMSSATLRLTGGMGNAAEPYTMKCIVSDIPSNNWDMNAVTWNSRPALGQQIAAFDVKSRLFNNLHCINDIDITSYVRKQIKAGITSIDIAVSVLPFDGLTVCRFQTKESDFGQPELVISSSP